MSRKSRSSTDFCWQQFFCLDILKLASFRPLFLFPWEKEGGKDLTQEILFCYSIDSQGGGYFLALSNICGDQLLVSLFDITTIYINSLYKDIITGSALVSVDPIYFVRFELSLIPLIDWNLEILHKCHNYFDLYKLLLIPKSILVALFWTPYFFL